MRSPYRDSTPRRRSQRCTWPLRHPRQERFHTFQVFRRIDADGVVHRFQQLDFVAVLKRPELLELLTLLQRGRLEARELEQKVALVTVYSNVFPIRLGRGGGGRGGGGGGSPPPP